MFSRLHKIHFADIIMVGFRVHGHILCALACSRVNAFYNAGSCTQAMKKRDIRTFFTVTPVTKRLREESQSSTVGNIEGADFPVESREGTAVTDAHGTVVENEPEVSDECLC